MSAPKPPPLAVRPPAAPGGPPPAAVQAAGQALQVGRFADAVNLLAPLVNAYPRVADPHYMLAIALKAQKDLPGAEREFRAAIALEKRQPQFHADLGALLLELGRLDEAERSLRAALALDRRFVPAVLPLSQLLASNGRAEEALQLTTPLVAARGAGEEVLSAHAEAQKAAGRPEDALATYRQVAAAFPGSAYADHNLAAVMTDLGLYPEAEAAARNAMAKGLDHPATWLVLGRAQQRQDRFDEAEDAFRRAIRRNPLFTPAHGDLAQLIWMRTGKAGLAGNQLSGAVRAFPKDPALKLTLAHFLEFVGEQDEAYTEIGRAHV